MYQCIATKEAEYHNIPQHIFSKNDNVVAPLGPRGAGNSQLICALLFYYFMYSDLISIFRMKLDIVNISSTNSANPSLIHYNSFYFPDQLLTPSNVFHSLWEWKNCTMGSNGGRNVFIQL